MLTLEEMFVPYQLRISCGPVDLRVLRDDDFAELFEIIRGGIFDPELPMPFLRDWTTTPYDPLDSAKQPLDTLRWWWSSRANVKPDDWRLALVVRRDGRIVGMQDVSGHQFPQTRSITTGSWLGRPFHGQGTGTLMRQAVVGWAFDHLGALECRSGYIDGNAASAAVSRKTGYVDNGVQRRAQSGADGSTGSLERNVRVTPETYIRPAFPIEVEGVENLRTLLSIEV